MKEFKEWSESFYDKVTLQQINNYLKGISRLIPNKDLVELLKKKFNLQKIKFNPNYTKVLAIEEVCCEDCYDHIVEKSEYQGRKVKLNDPTRSNDGKKKFYVYVKNEKGNVVKVGFGDPNMEIKRDDPARRKSFRARHNCDNPGPKWKARYWSCYQWRAGAKVDN